MNPNSILSPQVKLGLGISAAVALIIALIGVVLTFWYKKKLQKKFYHLVPLVFPFITNFISNAIFC